MSCSCRIACIGRLTLFASVAVMMLLAGCTPSHPPFPPTAKKPVVDEYFGTKVTDDYRWLDTLGNPQVKPWIDAQNTYTRSVLDKVPSRDALRERLKLLYGGGTVTYHSIIHRGKLFALKSQPPRQQPLLVSLDSPEDLSTEKVILDPGVLAKDGSTAIDFFVPSLNGKYVAVSLSRGGSEDGTAHVYETATGKDMGDVIPRVNFPTAAGSIVWNAGNSGFYYTRYPQGHERPEEDMNFFQQVYFHALGTPSTSDRYVIGREFPRIAEIALSGSDDGKYILAAVANGDGGEFAHYVMRAGGPWRQLTTYADKVFSVRFGHDGKLYLASHAGAPRGKILTLPLADPVLAHAKLLIPESGSVIEDVLPTRTNVYVHDVAGGPSEVRIFELNGSFHTLLPTPPVASIEDVLELGGDDILYSTMSYLEPLTYFRHNPVKNATTRTRLSSSTVVDYSDCDVTREFATSKDGTKIPMSIIHRKGIALDGKNPVILYGYGGYGISLTPTFSIRNRVWLDQGGVYVYANIRGGGEYGEAWHEAGKLVAKQNVFDDFIACAQLLIEKRYTEPSRLAIEGGSNGGLLMGAVMTQRPDLFRAVVSYVGIYDMLRVELFSNGAFNVTEFGSVKDPEQFKALYAYSPYHHVVDDTSYPAMLLLTGDNDGRVDPANSRKMAARLQAATDSKHPILLRTNSGSGHGIGTALNERIEESVDVFSFLFDQLGISFSPGSRSPGQ